MAHETATFPDPLSSRDEATDAAWLVALEAARRADQAFRAGERATFAVELDRAADCAHFRRVADTHHDAVLRWQPEEGWVALLPAEDPRQTLLDLYLPICSATEATPVTVGHLGQSLDGFIATPSGDSQFVTGPENIRHLHRMRALCDAIVVGAGTVAADDPQLTTRHVSGPSPLRVVLDPMRRLGEHYKVFRDNAAETLYVCGRSLVGPDERHLGRATLVAMADTPNGLDIAEVTRLLRSRGCHRIFVEGGGVTVSMFLEANQLDRLQVAVAALIIGSGRPAIRVPPRQSLSDCRRPACRVFRMGSDILFDCDLTASASPQGAEPPPPIISRVI